MDMQAIKEEVRLKLTGDVVSMELSDATLTKIVNSSLREIQRYIDTFRMVTVPYKECIDVSAYKMSSVTGVRRADTYMSASSETNNALDPMYASQWMLLSGAGNLGKLSEYTSNFAAWNSLLQLRNTVSTDMSFYYNKSEERVYINSSCGHPSEVTIIYIPRIEDVSEITSDYWQDVLVRLSVANTKIALGRVRTKFKQSNALWSLDGDQILEDGTAELNALRQELKDSTQLCYGVD